MSGCCLVGLKAHHFRLRPRMSEPQPLSRLNKFQGLSPCVRAAQKHYVIHARVPAGSNLCLDTHRRSGQLHDSLFAGSLLE